MWRAFLLFFALSGCIRDQALVTVDPWSDTTLITTQEREIYRSPDAIVVARPAIVMRSGRAGYAVLINVRRRDANEPRIEQITSRGHTLDYDRHDRLRTHCIDGCQKAEIGAIYLSHARFGTSTRSGLPLRIWGKRGRYAGVVPSEAFARVHAKFRN